MNPVAAKEMETCVTWAAAGRRWIFHCIREGTGAAPTLYSVIALEKVCLRRTCLAVVEVGVGRRVRQSGW